MVYHQIVSSMLKGKKKKEKENRTEEETYLPLIGGALNDVLNAFSY